MVVSIQQVAGSAQIVKQLTNTVKDDAIEGTISLNDIFNGLGEISQVFNETNVAMNNLSERSEEIVKNINQIKEMVKNMTVATTEQAS